MTADWIDNGHAALLTDLYELTMLEVYFQAGKHDTGVFDLFIRRLPPARNYLVACGLEHVLRYLETFSFSGADIDYLRSLHKFTEPFLSTLGDFHFQGE